jgi:hypothetical protein
LAKVLRRGIVSTRMTPARSEKPSHPEFADWLATQTREHRGAEVAASIVTSATYRQSSVSAGTRDRDPSTSARSRQNACLRPRCARRGTDNERLAQPDDRRPKYRLPQPAGVSELTYAGSAKWV